LKIVYKKAKYPIFPAECTSHFSCITSPLDDLRCKQQLEKSCLLHLREIHNSNLTYLGF